MLAQESHHLSSESLIYIFYVYNNFINSIFIKFKSTNYYNYNIFL